MQNGRTITSQIIYETPATYYITHRLHISDSKSTLGKGAMTLDQKTL